MSRTIAPYWTPFALFLAGCAYTISPLATNETVTDDPDLAGTWQLISKPATRGADLPAGEEVEEVTLEKFPNAPGSYWLEKGEEVLCIDLVKLDEALYLEVSCDDAYNRLFSIPLFQAFRVFVRGDELHVASCDVGRLHELAEKTNQRHIHRELDVILIGTTEELQQFYRKHGDAIFGKSKVAIYRKQQMADRGRQTSQGAPGKGTPAKKGEKED